MAFGESIIEKIPWLNEALEQFDFGDSIASSLVEISMRPENSDAFKTLATTGSFNLNAVINMIYGVGIALIMAKFVIKGIKAYGLDDGDPDQDPIIYAFRLAQAVVVAVCFNFLVYPWLTQGVVMFAEELISSTGMDLSAKAILTPMITQFTFSSLNGIASFIFIFLYIIVYFQSIKLGFDMLILRLGFPMSCVGIVDADYGVFKPVAQIVFQLCLTILARLFLLFLSLALIKNGSLIYGLVCIMSCVGAPRLIERFLLPASGGGGVLNTSYQVSMLANSFKNLVK